jgi:hypothetical protein
MNESASRKLAYHWVAEKISRALDLQSDTLPDEVVKVEVVKILKAFENAAAIPTLEASSSNGADHGERKNGHPP